MLQISKIALFLFMSALASIASAELATSLRSSGFACTDGPNSTRCRGKIAGFSQPIDVYIPSYFNSQASFTLVFHFMGYWTQSADNPFTTANGDYGTYLAASGQNALLILAESTGSDATYKRELNTAPKVDQFFKNVQGLLSRNGALANDGTPRLLTGHSGAYMLLGQIGAYTKAEVPALASLRALALFDCGYGYRAGLVNFLPMMRANGESLYFSAYNPSNSSVKLATMKRLAKELGVGPDITFVQNKSATHMSFMRNYMTLFIDQALGAKRR